VVVKEYLTTTQHSTITECFRFYRGRKWGCVIEPQEILKCKNCTSSCSKFLYITPNTRKGGIMDRSRLKGGAVLFFYAKGAKNAEISQNL
jgi:hypothetical protein